MNINNQINMKKVESGKVKIVHCSYYWTFVQTSSTFLLICIVHRLRLVNPIVVRLCGNCLLTFCSHCPCCCWKRSFLSCHFPRRPFRCPQTLCREKSARGLLVFYRAHPILTRKNCCNFVRKKRDVMRIITSRARQILSPRSEIVWLCGTCMPPRPDRSWWGPLAC